MLKHYKGIYKKWYLEKNLNNIARLIKFLMYVLFKTCRFQIEGIERFYHLASTEKCIIILWHNRLALMPYFLGYYIPQIIFTGLVSNSRDGELLNILINSYKNGRTIRVPHHSRYQALREIMDHIEKDHILVITPDGPQGPCYEMKPGVAFAALKTQSYIFPMNWEAKNYWKLNSWDGLRVPIPFTTIQVSFKEPIRFDQPSLLSLEKAQEILQKALPTS